MNIETFIVYNRATALSRKIVEALNQVPRQLEPLPFSQVVGQLEIHANILEDIKNYISGALLKGEAEDPTSYLASATLLEKFISNSRELVQHSAGVVQDILREMQGKTQGVPADNAEEEVESN